MMEPATSPIPTAPAALMEPEALMELAALMEPEAPMEPEALAAPMEPEALAALMEPAAPREAGIRNRTRARTRLRQDATRRPDGPLYQTRRQ